MNRIRILLLYLGGAALLVSFLCMLLAAIYYQGGTPVSSSLDHYSLTENLLTDLGRTKGYAGDLNTSSKWFFNISFRILLITLTIIHTIWVFTFQRHRSRLWAGASLIFMVLACFHLFGVTEFPQDENYPRHFLFLTRTVAAFAIVYTTAFFAYFFEPKYAHTIAAPFLIFGLLAGLRWLILIWGPDPWTSNMILFWHLSLQKVVWVGIYVLSIYHIRQILERLQTSQGA